MTKTHFPIAVWKLKKLSEIGEQYKVPFMDAPFDSHSPEEGYYDIDKFRKEKKWKYFIKEIEDLKVKYEYAFKEGNTKKVYMVVQIWEKKEI